MSLASLEKLGSWGSKVLDQASNQLAPMSAVATDLASTSFQKGADLFSQGKKAVKASIQEASNAPGGGGSGGSSHHFVGGGSHVLEDPREGTSRRVSEVSFLAEGAFGAVLKVQDSSNGQQYALKKIRCQEGVQVASSLKAAKLEAKILSTIPVHPNIIRCFGYSVKQNQTGGGMVMLLLELCRGGHLLDFMDKRNGKLSATEVLTTFQQIVAAVTHLHSQSPPIQHRDLKVENVLMGGDGMWKLCDFGSCSTQVVPPKEFTRAESMSLQEDIDKTVTMLYRPPEMADIELNVRKNYTINTQVDIWMLGCILYTLAFYRHPFQDNATVMAITNAKYFIPSDHQMARSKKLCGFIHWLLAADPKDRPTAPKILEIIPNLGKTSYEDLLASLPSAVREKIRKLDIYSARQDTGDLELPADLTAAVAAAGALARGVSAPAAPSSTAAQHKRASTVPAPHHHHEHQLLDGEFDINTALAPAAGAPPAPTEAPRRGKSEPAVAMGIDDLLAFNTPPPTPATQTATAPAVVAPRPNASGAGDLGDLLDFGAPVSSAPAAVVAAAPSPSASTSPQFSGSGGGSDWSANFDAFASAPTPSPMSGGYPQQMQQQPFGMPPQQQPQQQQPFGMQQQQQQQQAFGAFNMGMPASTSSNGSQAWSPMSGGSGGALSGGGFGAPQPMYNNGGFTPNNFAPSPMQQSAAFPTNFADFSAAPSFPAAAPVAAPSAAPVAQRGGQGGNLLDF